MLRSGDWKAVAVCSSGFGCLCSLEHASRRCHVEMNTEGEPYLWESSLASLLGMTMLCVSPWDRACEAVGPGSGTITSKPPCPGDICRNEQNQLQKQVLEGGRWLCLWPGFTWLYFFYLKMGGIGCVFIKDVSWKVQENGSLPSSAPRRSLNPPCFAVFATGNVCRRDLINAPCVDCIVRSSVLCLFPKPCSIIY